MVIGSLSAKPSGAPIQAGIGIGAAPSGTTITWSWSTAGAYNGSPLTVSVTGAGVNSAAASSPGANVNYGVYNSLQTLTVRVCDAVGRCAQVSVTSQTQPPPTVSIGLGSASSAPCYFGDGSTGNLQGCYNISISMSGWPGQHTVRCYSRWASTTAWVEFASFVAGNGTHNQCSYSSAGRVVLVSVDAVPGGNAQLSQAFVASGSGTISNIYGPWPTN